MPPAPFSGVLATVTIIVEALPVDGFDMDSVASSESLIRQRLSHDDGELHTQIRSIVLQELGPELDVDPLAVRHGSVELLIVVSTVYKLIKNSNEVLENLEKAVERIRRLIAVLVGRTVGQPTLTRSRVDPSDRLTALSGSAAIDDASQPAPGSALLRSGRIDATLPFALANFVVLLALLVVVAVKL